MNVHRTNCTTGTGTGTGVARPLSPRAKSVMASIYCANMTRKMLVWSAVVCRGKSLRRRDCHGIRTCHRWCFAGHSGPLSAFNIEDRTTSNMSMSGLGEEDFFNSGLGHFIGYVGIISSASDNLIHCRPSQCKCNHEKCIAEIPSRSHTNASSPTPFQTTPKTVKGT